MRISCFFLLTLLMAHTGLLVPSDGDQSNCEPKTRYFFSTDEKDYDLFLQERTATGSDYYFAQREEVLNSVKGKEATPARILKVYKAVHPFAYNITQAKNQKEGSTSEQIDAAIVEKSLSAQHRSCIIHEVKERTSATKITASTCTANSTET